MKTINIAVAAVAVLFGVAGLADGSAVLSLTGCGLLLLIIASK